MIAAVLLLAVGALAAATAHVNKSSVARGDIALVDPVPEKAEAATVGMQPIAPLFAGRSAASTSETRFESAAEFQSASRTNRQRFDFVSRMESGNSSTFRDFAGERRNANLGRPSGTGGFGGGSMGGSGGWGGASGGVSRDASGSALDAASGNANGDNRSLRGASASSQPSGSSAGSGVGEANGGGGVRATVLSVLPGSAAATTVPSAVATTPGPLSNSPGPASTPEPLTLLLVGSGLAGLYGARKHLGG